MEEAEAFYGLAPGVRAEVMADRALVVSYVTGIYYTVRGAFGIKAIAALMDGLISERVTKMAYPEDSERVSSFFQTLLAAGLVRQQMSEHPPKLLGRREESEVGAVWEIEPDNSLADMLTLDPIHEVGPEGWPERR